MLGLKLLVEIPFERLIEMKKKLFLLGFTVEGFEQTGGVDSVIDVDGDEDDFEKDERAEEDQMGGQDETQGEHASDGSGGGDLAIDELVKANFSSKQRSSNKSGAQMMVVTPMRDGIDADQEEFILKCVLTAASLDGSSSDGHEPAPECVAKITDQNMDTHGKNGMLLTKPLLQLRKILQT